MTYPETITWSEALSMCDGQFKYGMVAPSAGQQIVMSCNFECKTVYSTHGNNDKFRLKIASR